jgi:hypothetical protein
MEAPGVPTLDVKRIFALFLRCASSSQPLRPIYPNLSLNGISPNRGNLLCWLTFSSGFSTDRDPGIALV